MKALNLFLIGLIFSCICGCGSKNTQTLAQRIDSLAQYRDTLIGKFNGIDIDTLIAEPIDSINGELSEDDVYKGHHYEWRVYAANGTVKELILGNTIGIHFVKEGDLDGNGTDEWGYVTEYPTSNWMDYKAFTNVNGEWQYIIEPTSIWIPHIDQQDSTYYAITKEEILQPSENKNFLKVKFSDIRNEGEDFLVIDTLIRIKPTRIK